MQSSLGFAFRSLFDKKQHFLPPFGSKVRIVLINSLFDNNSNLTNHMLILGLVLLRISITSYYLLVEAIPLIQVIPVIRVIRLDFQIDL